MTPADLIAWAARMGEEAEHKVEAIGDEEHWHPVSLRFMYRQIADLRLAARLARFAAERGGLEEDETNGTKD